MQNLQDSLKAVRAHLSNAHDLAIQQHRPTAQIRSLQGDADALEELIGDQIDQLVRKLAEVEAGSEG
ncbi:MAG: hypothetical protein M3256_18170 [Actinomycetota bacterium]|nr:hypothetical protein [Actinomycetota bacterium]